MRPQFDKMGRPLCQMTKPACTSCPSDRDVLQSFLLRPAGGNIYAATVGYSYNSVIGLQFGDEPRPTKTG